MIRLQGDSIVCRHKVFFFSKYESLARLEDTGCSWLSGTRQSYSVEEIVVMNGDEWREFTGNLLESRNWLKGTGGTGQEQGSDYSRCILVVCTESITALLVDAQGYDYARYVAPVTLLEVAAA